MSSDPSFAVRFVLAFQVFFRILFDPFWAASVRALLSPASPPPSPSERQEEPDDGSNGVDKAARAEPVVAARPKERPEVEVSAPSDETAALVLLSMLQRDGRFLDFVQQDIGPFSDQEVGQVARVVHAGCRKVVQGHFEISPVRSEPEGSKVTVADAVEARKVKLTGNVEGRPPYLGTLRHRGWKTDGVKLPVLMKGAEVQILAPAEVEL